jgi:hypothetical protein
MTATTLVECVDLPAALSRARSRRDTETDTVQFAQAALVAAKQEGLQLVVRALCRPSLQFTKAEIAVKCPPQFPQQRRLESQLAGNALSRKSAACRSTATDTKSGSFAPRLSLTLTSRAGKQSEEQSVASTPPRRSRSSSVVVLEWASATCASPSLSGGDARRTSLRMRRSCAND